MTITLDIRPEVQAELARQAALQGRAIESVATALLEGAVHSVFCRTTGGRDSAGTPYRASADRRFGGHPWLADR